MYYTGLFNLLYFVDEQYQGCHPPIHSCLCVVVNVIIFLSKYLINIIASQYDQRYIHLN